MIVLMGGPDSGDSGPALHVRPFGGNSYDGPFLFALIAKSMDIIPILRGKSLDM
jgi:hypothetical protein